MQFMRRLLVHSLDMKVQRVKKSEKESEGSKGSGSELRREKVREAARGQARGFVGVTECEGEGRCRARWIKGESTLLHDLATHSPLLLGGSVQ